MLTHPFNTEGAKARLLGDYSKYDRLVVGLDFDNTVFDTNGTGGDFSEVIDLIKRAQKLKNFFICLFTAELNADKLAWKFNYLKDQGINIDYINDSPVFTGECKKPFFNILLDDRAGLESAYETLKYVVEHVEDQSH